MTTTKKVPIDLWTLVQHSGFGYAEDPLFMHGLESRNVTTKAQVDRIRQQGGYLFKDYVTAERMAEALTNNEDEDADWMIPSAKGEFSSHKIDGLAIYIATVDDKAFWLAKEAHLGNFKVVSS